ncbi:MAG: methyl-accepting chemotaxis protein [Lachnospiraceae bacterium]|nr:methyl-accepting chemotaxis protein [Lachnospiraceae bacterium]
MNSKKRKSLKNVLLTQIIFSVILIIIIITGFNINAQKRKIKELSKSLLSKESVSYANEIYSWWSSIEGRVKQTADVWKNSPELSYEDALTMLLELTKLDPDSQDIYVGYGKASKFLDGSGWIPDDTFVFTDRAWYIGAVDNKGEIYTSEPYIDASTGKTCLACSVLLDEENGVVLSSDINFDIVAEKLNSFESSAKDARYYIINTNSDEIIVSNVPEAVGQIVTESDDSVIKGLNKVYDSLNTENKMDANKAVIAKTSSGKMIYTATEIKETSWIVVSVVPYSFISDNILKTVTATLIIGIVLIVFMTIFVYVVISRYINPVSRVTNSINDMSNGDFTVSIKPEGNNEITTLSEQLDEYVIKMRNMLRGMTKVSNDMNNSAGECLNISHSLSEANKNQCSSIDDLNQIITSMNDSIDEVAKATTDLANTSEMLTENANHVRDLCSETVNSSQNGKEEMNEMNENVKTLNETVKELTDIIKLTGDTVKEITGITEAINAISSQTSLLSLNASIEAARAGEQGRGFAVVASEIGDLANQSQEATESISKLIDNITNNINDINNKADICMYDMQNCMLSVERANDSFDSIYNDVTNATDGLNEIADGIIKINDVASNNAAITEEQVATINNIINLSENIVGESNKILEVTDNISNISADLSKYSEAISNDLNNYSL